MMIPGGATISLRASGSLIPAFQMAQSRFQNEARVVD
jgi:hypothetical protein